MNKDKIAQLFIFIYFSAIGLGGIFSLLFFTVFDPTPPAVSLTNFEMLVIVISMSGVGACIHGITSLSDYIGNNTFSLKWLVWFISRPIIGILLGIIFYFLLRMGFVNGGSEAINPINPYAVAAFSGMVGMFSKQATDKLSEIFNQLFNSKADTKRGDSLPETGDSSGPPKKP